MNEHFRLVPFRLARIGDIVLEITIPQPFPVNLAKIVQRSEEYRSRQQCVPVREDELQACGRKTTQRCHKDHDLTGRHSGNSVTRLDLICHRRERREVERDVVCQIPARAYGDWMVSPTINDVPLSDWHEIPILHCAVSAVQPVIQYPPHVPYVRDPEDVGVLGRNPLVRHRLSPSASRNASLSLLAIHTVSRNSTHHEGEPPRADRNQNSGQVRANPDEGLGGPPDRRSGWRHLAGAVVEPPRRVCQDRSEFPFADTFEKVIGPRYCNVLQIEILVDSYGLHRAVLRTNSKQISQSLCPPEGFKAFRDVCASILVKADLCGSFASQRVVGNHDDSRRTPQTVPKLSKSLTWWRRGAEYGIAHFRLAVQTRTTNTDCDQVDRSEFLTISGLLDLSPLLGLAVQGSPYLFGPVERIVPSRPDNTTKAIRRHRRGKPTDQLPISAFELRNRWVFEFPRIGHIFKSMVVN